MCKGVEESKSQPLCSATTWCRGHQEKTPGPISSVIQASGTGSRMGTDAAGGGACCDGGALLLWVRIAPRQSWRSKGPFEVCTMVAIPGTWEIGGQVKL